MSLRHIVTISPVVTDFKADKQFSYVIQFSNRVLAYVFSDEQEEIDDWRNNLIYARRSAI